MTKLVFDFAEGGRDMNDLLGGKGANLAEMTGLGLPVPPGFVITTEACRVYLQSGDVPAELAAEVDEHLAALEEQMGKRLGDPADPLLVSVRSGAEFSMPGMMDTVLNIGLNDESVLGLAKQAGSERFAWDSYRRLLQMFGKTVLGVEGFEEALEQVKRDRGVRSDLDLDEHDLQGLVERFKQLVQDATGEPFPQDPRVQMDLATRGVFDSWNGERARLYRRQERIPADLGTAVNICSMVFGSLGMDSGTGVAFTRDPGSGAQGVYGDYLQNAQGEDVVAGIRNTVPLADLEGIDKPAYDELLQTMQTLEEHYRDLCDIEFTVERGKLWMLQTRVGKRTAGAAFRIATQLVDEGLISEDEALDRVTGAQLEAQDAALAALLPLQREDFTGILRAMDGLPVTVRLLDPPLHEFLPNLTELSVEIAVAEATGQQVEPKRHHLLEAVRRLHEQNPMIGLCGVRLGLVIPGLFAMQVRALAEAAQALTQEGLDPRPEVMVPLVGAVQELEAVREESTRILAEVGVEALVGTMIEIPRAALTAGEIAEAADFFSFGTNDLTQMGWGFSRDDVEASFFSRYLDLGIFGVSPFESIDTAGVGRLVRIAVDEGRAAKPGLTCGEHGGDPDSVHVFHQVGLDYVSCSPFRVPVARLEAGRAALADRT